MAGTTPESSRDTKSVNSVILRRSYPCFSKCSEALLRRSECSWQYSSSTEPGSSHPACVSSDHISWIGERIFHTLRV